MRGLLKKPAVRWTICAATLACMFAAVSLSNRAAPSLILGGVAVIGYLLLRFTEE